MPSPLSELRVKKLPQTSLSERRARVSDEQNLRHSGKDVVARRMKVQEKRFPPLSESAASLKRFTSRATFNLKQ